MPRPSSHESATASVGVVLLLLVLQRVIQFAREIVFARTLGPREFGIYALGFFLIPLLAIVASLGVPSILGRLVPYYEGKGAVRWFLRKTYTLTIVLAIGVAAAVVLAPGFFSGLLYGDATHVKVITLVGLAVPLMLVFRNVASTYLGFRLLQASSVFEFCQVALYALIGGVLVLVFTSASSAIFAYAVSFVLGLALFVPVLAGFVMRKEPYSRALDEKHFYRSIVGSSVWFMVTPILAQTFHYVDRLSIQHLMTSADQGVYSGAVAVAVLISAVGLAANNVIYPHLSAAWDAGGREEVFQSLEIAVRASAVALLLVGLVVVLLGGAMIRLLLGEAYMEGAAALPYLVVFNILTVSVWLLGAVPSLMEKKKAATAGLALALPVNVGLNLALIPRMGMAGAAAATMLSYSVMWVAVAVICRRLGLRIGPRTTFACLVPFALLLPGLWAGSVIGVVVILSLLTPAVLTADERARAAAGVLRFLRSVRGSQGGPLEPPPGSDPGRPIN